MRNLVQLMLILIFVCLLPSLKAQTYRVHGSVKNEKGDLLPFSSIMVKGTTSGTSANDKAKFSISLAPGEHVLVCQHIGYATTEQSVNISSDLELNFTMKEQKLTMSEVVVRTDREDPAYEIIRNAIKKRSYYGRQVKGFTCDIYQKDILQTRGVPKKIFGQTIDSSDMKESGIDSAGKGIIYLSEALSRVSSQKPDKFKMEVLSSRVSGSNSFGFSFPAFISLYDNNVMVFSGSFNPRGFVSPIADGAIGYYKFKLLGVYWEGGQSINTIQVTPRRKDEPLFTGVINISDDDWRIRSFDLYLTKRSQLEIMDTLSVRQIHVPVNDEVWQVKNQVLGFAVNFFGFKVAGDFLSVYSDYQLNPNFSKKYFDRDLIKYDTAVVKQNKSYWDSVRPVPLELAEMRDYAFKDSMMEVNKARDNNLDSLRKRQGKLKLFGLVKGGIARTHYGEKYRYDWGVSSFTGTTFFNTAEGWNSSFQGYFERRLHKGKHLLSVYPTVRYGFTNQHLNASALLEYKAFGLQKNGNLRRWTMQFGGGKRVSQFNSASPITELTNTVSTLEYGLNFMKIYENWFGYAGFSKKLDNGFAYSLKLQYEDRLPLDNKNLHIFHSKDSVHLTPNYPFEKLTEQFSRHQALNLGITLSFKPGQRYIRFPDAKADMGSKYPLLQLSYNKGIHGLLGSDVDFDKWNFQISDAMNMRLAGTMKYKLGIGGFLNHRSVPIQDYKHFNGNRTLAASEYVNSYQCATYYENSSVDPFYAYGHLEHHFNGLFTNKIPVIRRLKWNLVAGTNAFYVKQDNNYVDAFIGLENIFKVFRIDWVTAFEDGKKGESVVRIGAGGLLGDGMQTAANPGRKSRSISISF